MKRLVKDVVATFTEEGQIKKMSFHAVVEDDNGGQAARPMTLFGPFPELLDLDDEGNPLITPEGLETIAMELTEAQGGVFLTLESQVIAATTPLFTPEQATPVILPEAEQRKNMVNVVDETIAAVIARFTRFQMGYVAREAAAQAYKDAGYTGEVSPWITHFADNADLDYQTATDRILAQAQALRDGQFKLDGEQRMRKYKILSAPTIEEARTIFSDILTQVQTIEASLP